MVTTNRATTDSTQQELVITRVFDAPRDLVFRAWTEARHAQRWWGPDGFTAPVCEIDARPGGAIRIDMRGPDGVTVAMTGVFHEVSPERIVFTSYAYPDEAGQPGLEVRHTVTFADHETGKTKLTLQAVLVRAAPEMAEASLGMEDGWNQSLDRLASELASAKPGDASAPHRVRSKDGTSIAFDRLGSGPALILVAGALGVRAEPMMAGLATPLATHFTVYNYDRRGRGDSGDTQPYAVEREVEDIEALIAEAGGSAFVYGMSSGAVLALEAASRLPGLVKKVAMYEPPLIVDESRPPVPDDYAEQLQKALAEGRRDRAVALFMEAVGVPEEFVAMMRQDPSWGEMEAMAHTLPYDAAIVRGLQSGKALRPERMQGWSAATMPALVIVGGNSEPFFHSAARLLAGILPDGRYATLEGQDHAVSGDALSPLLADFFGA